MNAKSKKIFAGSGILIALAALFFILRNSGKKMQFTAKDFLNRIPSMFGGQYYFKPYPIASTNPQQAAARYLIWKEGGLSRDQADSAKITPAPWPHKDPKTGEIETGWHTNKGVTYATFLKYSTVLGYEPTEQLFFTMPEDLALKIFKAMAKAKGANITSSEILNLYYAFWIWGGSPDLTEDIFNKATGQSIDAYYKANGELKTLQKMIIARIAAYKAIVKAKPEKAKFLKGWINGALNYFYLMAPYASN